MTKTEFLAELQDMLQLDEELAASTDLRSFEEWDSISFMVLIAFFDKNFGVKITFEDLSACKTPEDVMALAQGGLE